MRQSDHAVRVRVLSGEQAGSTAGARWGCAEGLAEDDALLGESLDVRGPYGVTVRLYPPARVVRMNIEDIWKVWQAVFPSIA
jgi:hypothetical protein